MAAGSDLIVVGGGIIGLAIAREAALAGLSVRLLEKGETGREASRAAAGMLAAQAHAEGPDPLLALCLRSRELYPEFARRVRAESGIDPCLLEHGTLVVAMDDREMASLERQDSFQRAAGLEVQRLDRQELRHLEGSLSDRIQAALFLPRDPSIDNVLLVDALRLAAERC